MFSLICLCLVCCFLVSELIVVVIWFVVIWFDSLYWFRLEVCGLINVAYLSWVWLLLNMLVLNLNC